MQTALPFSIAVRGALFFACGLFVSGCRTGDLLFSPQNAPVKPPRPTQNRAAQIEVLATRVVDFTYVSKNNKSVKTTIPEVLVKWRNNGPEPVGMVRAKIQTWDSKGNELPYSLDKISILVARDPKDRIPTGHVYDEPVGSGYTLLMGENTPVRVKVTVVYADNSTPAFPDNSSGYEPGHYEGAGTTP